MERAYKYRIYPNVEQKIVLAKHFGATRFIYNHFLSVRQQEYQASKTSSNYYIDCKKLTEFKSQDGYSWLKEINAQSLQFALSNLEYAYNNFFRGKARFPKFHKRSNNQCIKIPQAFSIKEGKLWIPKLKSGIPIELHRTIGEGKQLSCFVSKTSTDKYYASVIVDEVIQTLPVTQGEIGIDLGIKNLVITSDGELIDNPKLYRHAEKTIKYEQKQLSKKKKGSKRKSKQRKRVALAHEKVANKRKDFTHKLTKQLINENQVIIAENLAVKNMIKNHKLAKSIQDASWEELTRQLKYKASWYGRVYYEIGRYFPSSKTCNNCKVIVDTLPLDIRQWDCPSCGVNHDRDHNATLNIREQGLRDLGLWNVVLQ